MEIEKKKKSEKIWTNLEQYTLNIMKILRTASLEFNFTGSNIKKSVYYWQEIILLTLMSAVKPSLNDTIALFVG